MTAAAGGHHVAMTEQRLTGGTCVNFGCTPSKALIRCARAVHDAARGAEFGFRLEVPPQIDFAAVMERVRRLRSMSSAGDAVEAVEQTGAQVYLGHARFTAPNVVDVDGRQLRFRKAVIATGSAPFVPSIEGLRASEYLTNESVFSLTDLPARLVVIGGGPLACELAQAFRRFGSEVDLVSATENLIPRDEPQAGELIRRRFEQEGLRLHLGSKAVRVSSGRVAVQRPGGTRELPYDALLLGTGRKPNVGQQQRRASGRIPAHQQP
jgi:pyruvate/2-oxoglutarate dehydrogenase complex dihydrolipoamide dehydrogenase (E3) component